ncbi:MAG: hypothetical protein ACLGRW_01955, partial [Acidobacteriota bacterium]
ICALQTGEAYLYSCDLDACGVRRADSAHAQFKISGSCAEAVLAATHRATRFCDCLLWQYIFVLAIRCREAGD